MIVLDASALIAYTQRRDPHHGRAADVISAATNETPLAMHAVTITECLVGPTRMGTAPAMLTLLETLGVTRLDLDDAAPMRVAALRVSTQLKLPDSFVLDAAIENTASLLTFDARLKRAAGGAGVSTL